MKKNIIVSLIIIFFCLLAVKAIATTPQHIIMSVNVVEDSHINKDRIYDIMLGRRVNNKEVS